MTRPQYWAGWNRIRETSLSTLQKFLLQLIHGYANGESEWAFAQVETFAKDMSLSDRHVKTLFDEVRKIGVVESRRCESRPKLSRRRKEHRIIWETLLKFHEPRLRKARQQGNHGSPIGNHQGNPNSPTQGNSDSLVTGQKGNRDSRITPIDLNNQKINTIHGENGVLKFAKTENKDNQSESRTRNNGGWPMTVTADTLNSLTQLGILWGHALANAWVTESDRLRFLTLACYCHRRQLDGALKSAGATFTSLLRKRKWFGDANDEERARIADRIIREEVSESKLVPTAQPPPTGPSGSTKKRMPHGNEASAL